MRAPTWHPKVATYGRFRTEPSAFGRGFCALRACYSSAMRIPWLFAALMLSALLSVLNLIALEGYWYWKYRWFDTPMHILGGLAIGALCIGLSRTYRPLTYAGILALAFLGWEVFEYVFHLSTNQPHYLLDTLHDLMNDAVGGLITFLIARNTIWHSA